MATTYVLAYLADTYFIIYSDGRRVHERDTGRVSYSGAGNHVQLGGTVLDYQLCTSPVASSASDLVSKILGLRYQNCKITVDDPVNIARDFYSDDIRSLMIVGYNNLITTATDPEDIGFGGGLFNFITSAQSIRVAAGGNAADDAAGAGARTITVTGLDLNWLEVTETLTLAGGSASAATTASFIRLNSAEVATSGTYGAANTGNIVIETTGGTALGTIGAGIGKLTDCRYSVPEGYVAAIEHLDLNTDQGSNATEFRVFVRENADDATAPVTPPLVRDLFLHAGGSVEHSYRYPIIVPANSDIWVRAQEVAGNTKVSATMRVTVIKTAP